MAAACSILFLFRPILLELGSAIRIDGASVSRCVRALIPSAEKRHLIVCVFVESDNEELGSVRRCSDADRCVSEMMKEAALSLTHALAASPPEWSPLPPPPRYELRSSSAISD